jgi:catechol 2,3-dioxygenase-like lactoylglutathione lyase family enzyme
MTTSSLVRIGSIVLDCPDPAALAGFYARLLGWPATGITANSDWVTLTNPDGGLTIDFQQADDYQAPTWPDPTRPQMFHFDLTVSDMAAAAKHAVGIGARPLDLSDDHPTFQVYADPAGHPFCLCAS